MMLDTMVDLRAENRALAIAARKLEARCEEFGVEGWQKIVVLIYSQHSQIADDATEPRITPVQLLHRHDAAHRVGRFVAEVHASLPTPESMFGEDG